MKYKEDHWKFSSAEPLGQFNQTWNKGYFGKEEFKFVCKVTAFFNGEYMDNFWKSPEPLGQCQINFEDRTSAIFSQNWPYVKDKKMFQMFLSNFIIIFSICIIANFKG